MCASVGWASRLEALSDSARLDDILRTELKRLFSFCKAVGLLVDGVSEVLITIVYDNFC